MIARSLLPTPYVLIFAAMVLGSAAAAQSQTKKMPEWPAVENFVTRYFRGQPDFVEGDLMSRGHVDRVVAHLAKMGWRVTDRALILKDTLEDSHAMVQAFNSPAGVKFMRKVKGFPLSYSKMDRITQQYGGRSLIQSVVRLPDGAKYASPNRAKGVPSLVDLLPKRGGSKGQRVADYNKPTGRIYTVKALLTRLKASHEKDAKKAGLN